MNTTPDIPDLPTVFAQMRTADDAARRTPMSFAAIRDLARGQTPEQRQGAIEYAHRAELGADAFALAETFVDQGDLVAAERWFGVAERYGVLEAAEERQATLQLRTALNDPDLPDDTVLGPPALEQRPKDAAGVRGISTATLDWADRQAARIVEEAQATAATTAEEARATAEQILAQARATAEQLVHDARREAHTSRTEARNLVEDQHEPLATHLDFQHRLSELRLNSELVHARAVLHDLLLPGHMPMVETSQCVISSHRWLEKLAPRWEVAAPLDPVLQPWRSARTTTPTRAAAVSRLGDALQLFVDRLATTISTDGPQRPAPDVESLAAALTDWSAVLTLLSQLTSHATATRILGGPRHIPAENRTFASRDPLKVLAAGVPLVGSPRVPSDSKATTDLSTI